MTRLETDPPESGGQAGARLEAARAGARHALRFGGSVVLGGIARVLLYGAGGAIVMLVVALLASGSFPPGGFWSQLGAVSLAALYAATGLAAGLVLGIAAAIQRALDLAQEEGVRLLGALTPERAAQAFPAVPIEKLRTDYERLLDATVEQMVGRLPVPGLLRRFLRTTLRQAFVEDFLVQCESSGATTVGFPQVRDWLARRGFPLLTAPLRANIKLWRLLVLGVAGIIVVSTVGLAAGLTASQARVLVPAAFAALGIAVLLFGLPQAEERASPGRWRLGVVVVAASLALWPLVFVRLWDLDLGAVWALTLVASLGGVAWGLRLALVEANRVRPGAEMQAPHAGRMPA